MEKKDGSQHGAPKTVVLMLGPLYFEPAIGRGDVMSVRITSPDELESALQEAAGKVKPHQSLHNLHIILKSSSISAFYDECVIDTFLGAIRPGGEIRFHILGSTFAPVQEGDVEEISHSIYKKSELLLQDNKSPPDDNGNWVLSAKIKNTNGTGDEEERPNIIAYPTDLAGVAEYIQSEKCRRILILAGAGMSVAAGIPDFRSAGGLYATLKADELSCEDHHRQNIRDDPHFALSLDLFLNNPLPFLEINRSFILGTHEQRWKATLAHRFVELLHAKTGKLVRLYTQNIDGLENQCTQMPKEKTIRVHGTMDEACCARCQSTVDISLFARDIATHIKDTTGEDREAPSVSTPIPCATCSYNAVKPSVIAFGEILPTAFAEHLTADVQDVDLLIILGTSLKVAPANSLVEVVPEHAVRLLVNREAVGQELGMNFGNAGNSRDIFAEGSCDGVLLELMEHLGWLPDLEPLLGGQTKLPESCAALLREKLG